MGQASWVLEQALPFVVVEDHIRGPFPLCHADLHHNILVDENFKITGILDWTNAQTVHLERFMICPEFTTFPGLSARKKMPQSWSSGMFLHRLSGNWN